MKTRGHTLDAAEARFAVLRTPRLAGGTWIAGHARASVAHEDGLTLLREHEREPVGSASLHVATRVAARGVWGADRGLLGVVVLSDVDVAARGEQEKQ